MARRRNSSNILKWSLIGGAIAGGVMIPLVPALKKRAMRATTILKKDHRMVSGLMMTLEMTPKINGMVRRRLFDQIKSHLMVHTQVEEEMFYPAIRNVTGCGSRVDDAYHEHQTAKDLLYQTTSIDPVSEEFDQKLAELKDAVIHHVEEEESEMFPRVEQRMASLELEEIGRRMHERKTNLKNEKAA